MAVNLFRLSLALFTTLAISYWYYSDSESSQYFNRIPRSATPPAPVPLTYPWPWAAVTAGYSINVQWPQSWTYGTYRLELFYSDKTLAQSLVASTTATSFQWKIPATLAGSYELRVTAKTYGDNVDVVYATSTFTVTALPASDSNIKVTSPTSKESSWVLNAKNTLSLGYSRTDGVSWSADIYSLQKGSSLYFGQNLVSLKSLNDMSHTFTIPGNWPTGRYIVNFYVFDAAGGFRMANSEVFYITSYVNVYQATPDLIVITSPTYQQVVAKGQPTPISWTIAAQFTSFNIELFNYNADLYADPLVQSIAENVAGSSTTFSFNVPSGIPASRYYYVRVSGSIVGQDKIGAAYSNFFVIKSASGINLADLIYRDSH